jgi:tRNA modification GTPase
MSLVVEALTPRGAGGVALVRLRGEGAGALLGKLAAGRLPEVGGLTLARLESEGELLDEALIACLGPDHFELGLHGGPGPVAGVLLALGGERGGEGYGPASVEASAVRLLEDAACDRGARVLLDQAQGALRRAVDGARGLERSPLDWLAVWARYERLLVPARVVLAGPVNGGKSTLFNLLVGEQRVAVSAEAGTTRDAIVGRATIGHYVVELVDTAGERGLGATCPGGVRPDSAAGVEAAGQALGRSISEGADLVLRLRRADDPGPTGLWTHADRLPSGSWPTGHISATGRPEHARRTAESYIARGLGFSMGDPWVPGAAVPPSARVAHGLARAFDLPPGPGRDAALDGVLGAVGALPLP